MIFCLEAEPAAATDAKTRATVKVLLGEVEARGNEDGHALSEHARDTGRLACGKVLEFRTDQQVTSEVAGGRMGEVCGRLRGLDGFARHAELAGLRVRRFGDRKAASVADIGVA